MCPTEGALLVPPTYRQGQDHNPRPWSHVSEQRLSKLLEDAGRLDELRAQLGLTRDARPAGVAGAGGCLSKTWHSRGHTWPDDGEPASLCEVCVKVFDSHQSDYRPEDWSSSAARPRRFTVQRAGADGFRVGDVPAYAEKAEDKYGGEPWAHVDPEALSALRFDLWAQYGGRYAPPEHKAKALRRREAKLAETERKREAAAQAEREAKRVYRF